VTAAARTILRGDIWFVNLDPAKGHEQANKDPLKPDPLRPRPCVVLSKDTINRSGGVVIVAPLTTKGLERANLTHRILIPEKDKIQEPGTRGLLGDSLALVYQMRAVDPAARFADEKRVAHLTKKALGSLEPAMVYILDIFI